LAVFLLILFFSACTVETSSQVTEDSAELPTKIPTVEATKEDELCGDNLCTGPENEKNCPADCQPSATATATTEPTEPPPSPSPILEVIVETLEPEATAGVDLCGDAVCSAAEQDDPTLCPQDCPAEIEPTPVSIPPEGPWQAVMIPSGELAHIGDPNTVQQEGGRSGEDRQVNVALILDGSGSMNADLPGSAKTKLVVAKEVLTAVIPQVPQDVHGALWIYGHRLPDEPKDESCRDIERVFALGAMDAPAYIAAVNSVSAKGYTPISDSIEQAALDLPTGDINSIVLVSDGEETCAGDPCAVAEALKASAAAVTIHVVGYAVDAATRDQLQCITRVTGGTYQDADDAAGLLRGIEEAMEAAVVDTILRLEVVDPEGNEGHANFHLHQVGRDERLSSGIAWKDNAVLPGSYDVLVDTLPWTIYQGLTLAEESRTTIRIPLSAVNVLTPDGNVTAADFYDGALEQRLGYFGHEGTVYLVPGNYRIAVNNSTSQAFAVESGATLEILLGAIQPVTALGEEISVNFYEKASGKHLGYYGGEVLLVPGAYAIQVNSSSYDNLEVVSGEVLNVQLGAVELSGDFEIYDESGKRLGYYSGTLDLAPGVYKVDGADGTVYENVVINAGEVTQLN
jgi:hypothetical protein